MLALRKTRKEYNFQNVFCSDALPALVIRLLQGKAYLGVLSFPRLDFHYALLQQISASLRNRQST